MRKRGWTERFRQATDLTPAGKTPILGPARCTAEEMRGYVARRNPEAPDIAGWYLAAGERLGVRGDLAFCHAVHETNAWRGRGVGGGNGVGASVGGVACVAIGGGNGMVGTGGPGWTDGGMGSGWVGCMVGIGRVPPAEAIEQAVEAHMQRLLRFASPERYVQGESQSAHAQERTGIYRRWTYWEDLDGVIHPARRDGSGTVAIWRRMLEWAGKGGENRMSGSVNGSGGEDRLNGRLVSEREAAQSAGEAAPGNEAELQWLMARGLLQQPTPEPGRAVTWAELAGLLRRWEEAAKHPEEPGSQAEATADRAENPAGRGETAARRLENPEA